MEYQWNAVYADDELCRDSGRIMFHKIWVPKGTGNLDAIGYGNLPKIAGEDFLLSVIVVAVITAVVYVYLKYSKQGYEISVVGESEKTARYIGINVKK